MRKLMLVLAALLLCSPVTFAEEQKPLNSEEVTQEFLSKDNAGKQSMIMDLLIMKQYAEARELMAAWEKGALEGQGPNDFLKSYVNDLEKMVQ